MKADERHKLKENQLAAFIQQFPEMLRKYSKLLVSLAVLVVLVLAVVLYLNWQHSEKVNKAWNEFNTAQNKLFEALSSGKASELGKAADEFGRVATDYPGTAPVTAWSLYYQGHTLLLQARQRAIDTARSGAVRDLQSRAEDALKLVIEREKYNPLVTPTAWLDLAGIYTDREDFTKARDALARVKDDSNADPGLRELAEQRVAALADAVKLTFVKAAPGVGIETSPPGSGTEVILPLPPASPRSDSTTKKDSK